LGNDVDGYLSATRWSATGTHKGLSIYGEPTGREVQVWGITQNQILGGRIVREWMLFNELDLMMQIAAARQAT
jgi:predicted ester cyclase